MYPRHVLSLLRSALFLFRPLTISLSSGDRIHRGARGLFPQLRNCEGAISLLFSVLFLSSPSLSLRCSLITLSPSEVMWLGPCTSLYITLRPPTLPCCPLAATFSSLFRSFFAFGKRSFEERNNFRARASSGGTRLDKPILSSC